MTRRVVLYENGLARRRELEVEEAIRAAEETEVPCAGCGRDLRGSGILCGSCRRCRQPSLEEAA